MDILKLVFYQNMLSTHQSATIRALAAMGHDVAALLDTSLLAGRRELGLPVADYGAARVVVGPTEDDVVRFIDQTPPDAIHLVGGTRGCRCSRAATLHLARTGRRFGVLSEAGDPRGAKGRLRRWVYRMDRWRWGYRADFVLAMGELGENWFRSVGYPPDMVYPYCYTSETREYRPVATDGDPTRVFRMVYVGKLITLKRVTDLLGALDRLWDYDWRLDVIGTGPMRQDLEAMARQLGISERIAWRGATPNDATRDLIALADLLVLPSGYDGWGAVVNEALMAGTPVVCSDACGAACLLADDWRGLVYRAGSVEDLAAALSRALAQGKVGSERRDRIRAWSSCISGESVARYMVAVLEHVYAGAARPAPPWSAQVV